MGLSARILASLANSLDVWVGGRARLVKIPSSSRRGIDLGDLERGKYTQIHKQIAKRNVWVVINDKMTNKWDK